MTSFDQTEALGRALAQHTLPEVLPADPMPFFKGWFDEAHAGTIQPNPNAMTLATIDPDGRPSARIVLCKGLDVAAGFLVFYTNYEGRKGRALAANPRAAVVFHWDTLDRQARFEGPVVRSPGVESDAYFAGRPWESRIGAWASRQSEPLDARRTLLEQVAGAMARFGLDPARPPAPGAAVEIPRPPFWGGFRLWAERVELWLGGVGRIHDRAAWTRRVEGALVDGACRAGPWSATRLQP